MQVLVVSHIFVQGLGNQTISVTRSDLVAISAGYCIIFEFLKVRNYNVIKVTQKWLYEMFFGYPGKVTKEAKEKPCGIVTLNRAEIVACCELELDDACIT